MGFFDGDGKGIDRYVYEFETEDVGGGDDYEAVAPTPPAPEDEAPPEPTAEEPFAIGRDDWNRVNSFIEGAAPVLQTLNEALQYEQPGQQQPTPELPDYDPFDPESVQRYIDEASGRRVEAMLDERLAPFEPLLGRVAAEQGRVAAEQALDGLKSEIGDFDREQAVLLTQSLLSQGIEPHTALRAAAERTHDFESRIREDERNKVKAEHQDYFSRLAGATPAASAGGAAGEIQPPQFDPKSGVDKYRIVVNNALGAQTPIVPGG